MSIPDLDIDVPKRQHREEAPLVLKEAFPELTRAVELADGRISQHNTGWYLRDMPRDKATDCAAMPYEHAEEAGFFKFDVCSVSFMDALESQGQAEALYKFSMSDDYPWDILLNDALYDEGNLFQLRNWKPLVQHYQPRSLGQLAMLGCLVRPGKKALRERLPSFGEMEAEGIWIPDHVGDWKQPHAFGYAAMTATHAAMLSGIEIEDAEPRGFPAEETAFDAACAEMAARGWVGEEYAERLAAEIGEVESREWGAFVEDCWLACAAFREGGILTGAGRGTGCSSLLMGLLGGHCIDPVKHGIGMEWFFKPPSDKPSGLSWPVEAEHATIHRNGVVDYDPEYRVWLLARGINP